MKTEDILIDLTASKSDTRLEPRKGNVVNPVTIVITGAKYTLVSDMEIEQDSMFLWKNLFSGVKSFRVYDPDGELITNYDSEKVRLWIVEEFGFVHTDEVQESSYSDVEDFEANSILVELGEEINETVTE